MKKEYAKYQCDSCGIDILDKKYSFIVQYVPLFGDPMKRHLCNRCGHIASSKNLEQMCESREKLVQDNLNLMGRVGILQKEIALFKAIEELNKSLQAKKTREVKKRRKA